MKTALLITLLFFFGFALKADQPDYRYKVGVNVNLQSVLDWNSASRWTDIHYHKVSFFGLGLTASEKINNFDLSTGIYVHEETIDNFTDQINRNAIYYTLRSSHLSIPLGVDIKITKHNEHYLFARLNYILDYMFNAQKTYLLDRYDDNSFSFFRDYFEFGLGYNTMIKENYGFRAVISYFPVPLRQDEIFGDNIRFSKFGISVGAYKCFR